MKPLRDVMRGCYNAGMSIDATHVLKAHITSVPSVCGGRPCIAGTRIRVHDIYVWHELQGQSPDQIVHDFPQLTLADVYAALAYFWDNRVAVLGQFAEDTPLVER